MKTVRHFPFVARVKEVAILLLAQLSLPAIKNVRMAHISALLMNRCRAHNL
jgi:hypothetical protein